MKELSSVKTGRNEYLNNLYQIWGVGPTPDERMAFLDKFFGPVGGNIEGLPKEIQLQSLEAFHIGEEDWGSYTSERGLFSDKFYWEHGVGPDPAFRLRYWESNLPFKNYLLDYVSVADLPPLERLERFEQRYIYSEFADGLS
ncbi:MAG: hypothetical protein WCQ00_00660 [bacterium]